MIQRLTFLALPLFVAVAVFLPATSVQAGRSRPQSPQEAISARQSDLLERAGLSALNARDYADAVTDLRRAVKLEPNIIWIWAELGLALDYQGKREEAFTAYQKGFGQPAGSTFGTNRPDMQEAIARFGAMCENRGLHDDAVHCFNAAREWEYSSSMEPLDKKLDAKTCSPELVRMMLYIVQGGALEDNILFGRDMSAEAMYAFRAALKLAPSDPRPRYFLAYGLRRAGRFAEAEAALQRVSRLDKNNVLKSATAKSLELVRKKWAD